MIHLNISDIYLFIPQHHNAGVILPPLRSFIDVFLTIQTAILTCAFLLIKERSEQLLKDDRFKNLIRSDLRKDLIAGITVGVVAIPLGMAFAIASGVKPEYGLYTTVFAGFVDR